MPVAADPRLLTGVLRDRWGFDGPVVADYFGVAFLHLLHEVAGDLGEAAGQALAAGVDIELPTGDAYLAPLAEAVRAGRVDEALVDRAVLRALRQKEELGPARRDVRRRAADAASTSTAPSTAASPPGWREESVVLLSNDGTLPLAAPARVAVIGPNADRAEALFGCYSFLNHVLAHHPEVEVGFESPTVRQALAAELPRRRDRLRARLRGRRRRPDRASTRPSGRRRPPRWPCSSSATTPGCSAGGPWGRAATATTWSCPGVQRELVEAVLATGTPVVLVLLTGRPYAIDWALERCAAVVQAFFPGEEGGTAVAGVLSGRVNPSGHLPVSMPRSAGAQPFTYLHPPLGGNGDVTNLRSTPALPFGHGLSYTTFVHSDLEVDAQVPTDGHIGASVRVTNTGDRPGADVVQLYAHDVVGSVTRPVAQLVGYRRVHLEAGESALVDLLGADGPARVLRPRPRARGRAGRGRGVGGPVVRRARDRGAHDARPVRSTGSAWTARAGPRCRSPAEPSRGRRPRSAARRRPRCAPHVR